MVRYVRPYAHALGKQVFLVPGMYRARPGRVTDKTVSCFMYELTYVLAFQYLATFFPLRSSCHKRNSFRLAVNCSPLDMRKAIILSAGHCACVTQRQGI